MGQSCHGCFHGQQGGDAATLHDTGATDVASRPNEDDAIPGRGQVASQASQGKLTGQAANPPLEQSKLHQREAEGNHTEKDGHPREVTGAEAYAALAPEVARQLDEHLEAHRIFEAYSICPAFVEAHGCMQHFRSAVDMVWGRGCEKWDGTLQGVLGDPEKGDRYMVQHRWGGATPESEGTDFLWAKLSLDQNIPLWKAIGAWHETEWEAQHDKNVTACDMVGAEHPCHAIRCNFGGLAHELLGKRQDYVEVFRYVNFETGFIVECNRSVDHDELVRRGHKLEPPTYKKGHEVLIYLASWPRSETQNTVVKYIRVSTHFPRWLVNLAIRNFLPMLVEKQFPKMLEKTDRDPDLQRKLEEDRRGIHAYFRAFCERGLAAGTGRYNAVDLPPKELVLGRWAGLAAARAP